MMRIAVTESSGVAEARRQAGALADRLGFDESDAGRVRLVVTELATNIVKHGNGGQILVGESAAGGVSGIDVLAFDNGPGIARLDEALADGYSSSGTAGNGLGAILRQSHGVEVATWPGLGTAVHARLEQGRPGRRDERIPVLCGAVTLPHPGEEVCGDAWKAESEGGITTILVADGLGHGANAAAAANEAVRVFQRHKSHQVNTLLDYVHGGLRPTRGAAIAIARADIAAGKLEFGGIGNIAGAIVSRGNVKRLVSMPGTAGHNARKIQTFNHPFTTDDLLILHSDGLGTSWSLDRYPGLSTMHPTLIAGVLCRDFWRQRDDVTVVVMRGGTAS
jgi:anti-sigma regulatory factor (Ser/Thr protein kinase)